MIWILESMLIGLIAGLFGLFYRNVEKGKNMLLNEWFFFVLQPMAYSKWWFLRFISRPLGYCVYCSTFWITLGIYLLYYGFPIKETWELWTIGLVTSEGMQHIVLLFIIERLVEGSKDFDPKIWTVEDNEEDKKKRAIVNGFYLIKETKETKETKEETIQNQN